MNIHTNMSLKNFTTMQLGGNAKLVAEIMTIEDLRLVCNDAKLKKMPIFVLGGGSNVIAKDSEYDGVVLHMCIPGFQIITEDDNSVTLQIGAGEQWDEVVKRTVDMKLSGIEAMSFIPGTAGASPVQNVGAYGQEIADTLQSLVAYDTTTNSLVTLQKSDCRFSYRNSIFRDKEMGRYIITSITIKLSKKQPQPPFYESLQKYLDDHKITKYTQATIRDAVIAIRNSKLPNPKIMPNSGSFFKNAIVTKQQIDNIRQAYPEMPSFDMGNGQYKIPTGWLIEKAGLKGQLINGIRIYDKNALVLINESAQSYNDLAKTRDEIIRKIYSKFGVQIEQEPLEI